MLNKIIAKEALRLTVILAVIICVLFGAAVGVVFLLMKSSPLVFGIIFLCIMFGFFYLVNWLSARSDSKPRS